MTEYLAQRHSGAAGPPLTIFPASTNPNIRTDIEVAAPVLKDIPSSQRVRYHLLPGVPAMLCVVHQGPGDDLAMACSAAQDWIQCNGYQATGPMREVHLTCHSNSGLDDSKCVAEIQFPVVRDEGQHSQDIKP